MDVAHPEASISTEISSIPLQRCVQALFYAVGRRVAEVASGFGDVGDGVADVAGAEVLVLRSAGLEVRIMRQEAGAEYFEEGIQARAVAKADVVNLVDGVFADGGGGEEVGLNHVFDVAEIAAGFAVAVDVDGLFFDHGRDPGGNYSGIRAVRILARAEDVEVAQAN